MPDERCYFFCYFFCYFSLRKTAPSLRETILRRHQYITQMVPLQTKAYLCSWCSLDHRLDLRPAGSEYVGEKPQDINCRYSENQELDGKEEEVYLHFPRVFVGLCPDPGEFSVILQSLEVQLELLFWCSHAGSWNTP